MPRTWPHDTIRELLSLALAQGEAKATLADEREAELFRFAIYNFRRQTGMGLDLQIAREGETIVLTKIKPPIIHIEGLEEGAV